MNARNQVNETKSTPDRSTGWVGRVAKAFYRDTRLLTLMLALILVSGLSSLAILPRMEDPVLRRRVAIINTRLPGADAERVESLVTEKLEDELRDIEEIKELRSVSRTGISTISIELLDTVMETDTVWSRVRSRIEDSLPSLPPDATRPSFEELQVRAYALIMGLVWERESPADVRLLRRLAIDLQDKLQNVSGTELVDRFGDPGEEILVRIDPGRAASMGVTPADISERIEQYDAKGSAGLLRSSVDQMLIEVGNQLDAVSHLADIPVTQVGGRDVRLADVASVEQRLPQPVPRAAKLDQGDAVVLGVMVRPAVRIDQWTERAERMLSEFDSTLPSGVAIQTVLRQSDYVDDRLSSLTVNLILGGICVSIVICLLMGWRSALIVTLTLPLASLMVLFGLRMWGIPIHQMSVTGLIIALGLLIDNAIVMVDEVRGRIMGGDSPADAMAGSVSHLAGPLIGSTLTTALAFAPIALMPGPAGEFVGSIAISVMMAIFASLLLAMTVIPSIAARLVRVRPHASAGGQERQTFVRFNGGIELPTLAAGYKRLVTMFVRRPWTGVATAMVLPLIGFGLAPFLDEQFFPPSGRDQFHITIEGPATSSIGQTRMTASIADAIARENGALKIDWFYGESAPQFYYNVVANRRGTANFAQGLVTIDPAAEPTEVIRNLQQQLDERILSSRVLVRQLEQGPPFEAPVEVRLFGPDLDVLRGLGDQVRQRLSGMPEVVAVRTDLAEVLPQLSFEVNQAAASSTGLTPTEIARQLQTSLEGATGGSVLQANEELPVVVRVGDDDRGSLARVRSMNVLLPVDETGDRGDVLSMTPVSAVADVTLQPESAAIPRLNRRRMNEVNAYLVAGVLPSVVQSKIESTLESNPLDMPTGYNVEFGGEASKRDDAVGNLFSTVGVLGVLMLATLVLSFGSFRMAGMIALVAALSVGLGLAALAISGYSFGFMAIIGTMGLIGVAINDSIVVLAGIRANPAAVAGDIQATVTEVMHATRHVIATTLTTMAGFAPLILDGGAFWPPMAVSIAGGVAGATLLALVLIPSLHQSWLTPKRLLDSG
ncbi:MAG: efflux RND transporter permease subunit [Planctomycetota bacterium]